MAQGTKDLTFNIKINHYYYSRISSARDYKSTGTLNISLDIRCIRDFCKKMAKSYSAVTIIQLSGLNTNKSFCLIEYKINKNTQQKYVWEKQSAGPKKQAT